MLSSSTTEGQGLALKISVQFEAGSTQSPALLEKEETPLSQSLGDRRIEYVHSVENGGGTLLTAAT